jgi:hypothetical protein
MMRGELRPGNSPEGMASTGLRGQGLAADEPALGLAPLIVAQLMELFTELRSLGNYAAAGRGTGRYKKGSA